MGHSYTAFDPAGKVNGATIQAVDAAFHTRQHAHALLLAHNLPSLPQADKWYPLQNWLDLLADLEANYGQQTVYAVGLQIAACSVWPASITTLPEALHSLDDACRANVNSAPMGYYRVEPLGASATRVICHTPTPPAFEYGIITGIARKFKPQNSLRLRVEQEAEPEGSPHLLKWFRVTWSLD